MTGLILTIVQASLLPCFCGHEIRSYLVAGVVLTGEREGAPPRWRGPGALGTLVAWFLSECNFSGLDGTPARADSLCSGPSGFPQMPVNHLSSL